MHGLGTYNSIGLSYSTPNQDNEPTLSYTCSCAITRSNQFLSTVKAVCFDCM